VFQTGIASPSAASLSLPSLSSVLKLEQPGITPRPGERELLEKKDPLPIQQEKAAI
jgi:hypothetical protein